MFAPADDLSQIRWLKVNNLSGMVVPGYAVMEVTGFDTDTLAWDVQQPTSDSISPAMVLINGPIPIQINSQGQGTHDFPIMGRAVTAAAVGDQLGTTASSWDVTVGNTGFFAWTAGIANDGSFMSTLSMNAAGGSSTRMIKFTGGTPPFETDGGSPECFYYASTQTWTFATGRADETAIWAVPVYSITPVPGSPPTIVKVNGTALHLAWDTGKKANPNSKGSRPVYWFDAFSAAFRGGCGNVDGVNTFKTDNEG